MKKTVKSVLCLLLSLLLLGGCTPAQVPEESTDDSASAAPTESDGANETDAPTAPAETEAVTEPETEADINVPRVGPFTDTTDLVLPSYSKLPDIERVEYQFAGRAHPNRWFSLVRGGELSDNGVLMPGTTVGGFSTSFKVDADEEIAYTFTLTCSVDVSGGKNSAWNTTYVGLRTSSEGSDPTVHTGIWLAMRNSEIGIRTGNWPQTSYIPVTADFAAGARVTIVDEPSTGLITIYIGEGDSMEEIAYLTVNERNLKLSSASSPKTVKDVVSADLSATGFFQVWAHIPGTDAYCEDVVVERADGTPITAEVLSGNTDSSTEGILPSSRDLFSDTLVYIDGAGRTSTDASQTSAPNGNKAGIFYFLWHEESCNAHELYDHTAAYEAGGREALVDEMVKGELGFAHYWAQPYFGYYSSNDKWVVRKHGAMLANAGIDFVFFDATNGLLYRTNYETVLSEWAQMREEGVRTPDVCFMCGANYPGEVESLWNELYSVGLYRNMWFMWDGKPLILFTAWNYTLTAEQKNFFTVRVSWANEEDTWYTQKRGVDCWAWGAMYPQKGGFVRTGSGRELEQMAVMSGFWVNGSYGTNAGRSYTFKTGEPKTAENWDFGYALYPETSGLGLAFEEQFARAIEQQPRVIMITGWNEWWAGRWEAGAALGQTIADEYTVVADSSKMEYNYFVDNFNPEYSRDIEPMSGGYGDNYYAQLTDNLRKYKGSRAVEAAFGQWAIDLDGSLGQWYAVGPEYRDVSGDVTARNHLSFVGGMRYTDNSGRNDFVTCKVSSDDTFLYFMAECAADITAPEGSNWMNLFLNTDGDLTTGWCGFDFVLNRSQADGKVTVEAFPQSGEWAPEKVGDAEYRVTGNTIQIKVTKALVGYSDGKGIDFKWADNSVSDGDEMQFWDKGDTAPDGRFCYRFTVQASAVKLPDCLSDDMIVLKAGSYHAFVGKEMVMLDRNSTRAVLLASGERLYLPVSFLESIGISVGSAPVFNHYGTPYVEATDLLKSAGRVVTVTGEGLVVLSDAAITDTRVLDSLYRSLY